MARPVEEWVHSVIDMFAAGLHRLVSWLFSAFDTVDQRISELVRRWPSAPADQIRSAYDWAQAAWDAGRNFGAGLEYHAPLLPYEAGIGTSGDYVYDIAGHIIDGEGKRHGLPRVSVTSLKELTIDDINKMMVAEMQRELDRIRSESPGAYLGIDFQDELHFQILSTYRIG